MLVAPLRLTATATLVGPLLEFAVQAENAGKASLKLQVTGRHDRSSDIGSAKIVLDPIVLHRGSIQPGDLFPILGGLVDAIDGEVEFGGALSWNHSAIVPDLTVRLRELAFTASGAQFHSFNGDIKIKSLWPPTTLAGQTLTASIDMPGLPSANLNLTGQLVAGPKIRIERIAVGFAGGEVVTSPFTIDPDTPEIDTSLQVDRVDLAVIINLLGIEGLSGTGRLDGQIPFGLKDGMVTISGGRLIAREAGLLRYQPAQLPAEIAAAGSQVELALQALNDFHYDRLMLDLDKNGGGEGTVFLRLEGRNPKVMSGQAFNFNIRIESNFDRLVDYTQLGLKSTQELLRQAARRAGR